MEPTEPTEPTGIKGADGTNGTNGTPGIKGGDGTNRTNGTNGIPGIKGPDGMNGTNGTPGIKGADGTNGTNGTNGNIILPLNNTFTGTNAFNSTISCNNAFVRNPFFGIGGDATLYSSNIGVCQFIVCGSIGRVYTLTLPLPSTCNGAMMNIYNRNGYNTILSLSNGNFVGMSGSFSNQYCLPPVNFVILLSDGTNWSVFNNSPILNTNNNFTGVNTFGKMHSYVSPLFINKRTVLVAADLNIGQYIETQDSGATEGSGFSIFLPDPATCQSQIVHFFINNANIHSHAFIWITEGARFGGRFPNTGDYFFAADGETYTMISNYYTWIIM